jgi:hypothetical protein
VAGCPCVGDDQYAGLLLLSGAVVGGKIGLRGNCNCSSICVHFGLPCFNCSIKPHCETVDLVVCYLSIWTYHVLCSLVL